MLIFDIGGSWIAAGTQCSESNKHTSLYPQQRPYIEDSSARVQITKPDSVEYHRMKPVRDVGVQFPPIDPNEIPFKNYKPLRRAMRKMLLKFRKLLRKHY